MTENIFEKIIKALGQPFWRSDSTAIYNGDSLELIKNIPDESVDLFFTSPPYNIGKEYEQILERQAYINWCADWLKLAHKKTASNGAFLLNVGYFSVDGLGKAVPITYLLWPILPYFLQQEIIWNYGAGVAAKTFLSPRNEKLMWLIKTPEDYCFNLDSIRDPDVAYPNQKKKGKLRCNTIGKNPSDVWQIAKVTSGTNRSSPERTSHPAQFPIDLVERVIKGFSNDQGLVIDIFAGSGSTLVGTSAHNRFGIGFEIRRDYCEIAVERLKAASQQLSFI